MKLSGGLGYSHILGKLFFLLFISGCALQSSMVDIEDASIRLRKHQLQLQRRLERLERSQRSPSLIVKNQQSLSADLVAEIEAISADVREFSGQVNVSENLISKLENRFDAESFRTKELLKRLSALQQRISALEKKDDPPQEDALLSRRRLSPTDREKKFFAPRDAFNLAYNDYVKGNYNVAILAFDAFIGQYPESRLIPQALYWKGESYYGKASYQSAINFFNKVIDEYPKSEKVSKALLKAGFSYLELKDKDRGRRFLDKVITRFPNSNEASLARDTLFGFEKTRP